MSARLVIAQEDPTSPDAIEMINALDTYLFSKYPKSECILANPEELKNAAAFFVVRNDRQALGCGGLMRSADGFWEIKRMYVKPTARSLGVGKLILKTIVGFAQKLGIETIFLETGPPQVEALGLYEKAGFERRGPYGGHMENPLSVFMEKRLVQEPVILEGER